MIVNQSDCMGRVQTVTLPPEGHQAYNIYTWVNQIFSGCVQIVSTVPIVSLSLNAEASTPDLVVSSLPPGSGQLDVAVDRALRKTAKGLCAPGSGLKARHRAQVDDEFTSEVDRESIRDRAPFRNAGAELQGVS